MNKIIPYQNLPLIRKKYPQKKIVLCHGVFDLIHAGHIFHLKQAKAKGDILVVTLTADKYIHKQRKPIFNTQQRAELIASLDLVDYVSTINESSAMTPIRLLKPDFHVKGAEFKKLLQGSRQYNIHKEKALLDKYGGQLYFTEGQTISPLKIGYFLASASEAIEENPFFSKWGSPFEDLSASGSTLKEIERFLEGVKNLKIAIIGESIIDRWIHVKLHGPSHKSFALSGKTIQTLNQIGGAGIVALHLASFVKTVDLYTNDFPKNNLVQNLNIIPLAKGKDITTRYVNQETNSTLYVNHTRTIKPLLARFPRTFKNYDAVLIADFGYGLLDEKTAAKISAMSKTFLACVVQANSSNYGFNLPNKYNRAHYYSLSKLEAELCLQKRFDNKEELVHAVSQKLKTPYTSVTFGQEGSILFDGQHCLTMQALSRHIKDTIGCGDAYFALSSLALANKQSPRLALLVGSIGAAIMAQRLCNEKPISQEDFLTAAEIII